VDQKKKVLGATERKEEERKQWQAKAQKTDRRKFIFLDECGSNIALTRLYARAPKGKRAYGSIPRNRGKNVTLLTCLSLQGIGESLIVDGAVNAELFEKYIEHILLPSLQPGQIVVMDNARIHKGKRVKQLIEERGCQVLFLPAYSPDFSPIEEAFSKIKTLLRQRGARTREALQCALEDALLTVSTTDALGWFTHCGYAASSDEV
jgi:transposase